MAYTATQTLATSKSAEEVTAAAQSALTAMGLRPTVQGANVVANSGSFFLTWILGFIGPETNMPIRVTVAPSGGTVTITAVDTYPIPIKIGINGKIHRRADALAMSTRQALEQQLG